MDEIQTWKIMLKVYLLSGLDEGLLFWPHLDLYIIFKLSVSSIKNVTFILNVPKHRKLLKGLKQMIKLNYFIPTPLS